MNCPIKLVYVTRTYVSWLSMRKLVVFRISNIDVTGKNGFWLISQRLLSGFAQHFAHVLRLYRCPLQACFLCQKWPVDPSRKGTFRAEIHKVAGQRAFVAGASPGVRQLEKQKSPFPNLRLLFRKGATFCMWPTACPPLHKNDYSDQTQISRFMLYRAQY